MNDSLRLFGICLPKPFSCESSTGCITIADLKLNRYMIQLTSMKALKTYSLLAVLNLVISVFMIFYFKA